LKEVAANAGHGVLLKVEINNALIFSCPWGILGQLLNHCHIKFLNIIIV
jgi:hypothetical protein